MSILFEILLGFGLGVIAHHAALLAIGNHMEKNKTFVGFVADLQSRVYFCIGFVFLVWFVAGDSSLYFTLFMLCYFFTFLRLDFESVEEYYLKRKRDL